MSASEPGDDDDITTQDSISFEEMLAPELGRTKMPVSELLRLDTGTVIELDRQVGEAVEIFVNDRLVARGEIVLVENKLGVTMTEIIKPQ